MKPKLKESAAEVVALGKLNKSKSCCRIEIDLWVKLLFRKSTVNSIN